MTADLFIQAWAARRRSWELRDAAHRERAERRAALLEASRGYAALAQEIRDLLRKTGPPAEVAAVQAEIARLRAEGRFADGAAELDAAVERALEGFRGIGGNAAGDGELLRAAIGERPATTHGRSAKKMTTGP